MKPEYTTGTLTGNKSPCNEFVKDFHHPRKQRRNFLQKKWRPQFFWDVEKILLIEYIPNGTPITANVYNDTIKRTWKRLYTKKYPTVMVKKLCFCTTTAISMNEALRNYNIHLLVLTSLPVTIIAFQSRTIWEDVAFYRMTTWKILWSRILQT